MNIDQEFIDAYKAWVSALSNPHGLLGKVDDYEMREVMSDDGTSKIRHTVVADSEKCLVKRTWDNYVALRERILNGF